MVENKNNFILELLGVCRKTEDEEQFYFISITVLPGFQPN